MKWLYATKYSLIKLRISAKISFHSTILYLASNELMNLLYYDQLLSLKSLLEAELPEVIYDTTCELENGKIIHRIYVPFEEKFNIHNKNTWRACYEFFVEKMSILEAFFYEYEDVIKNV